MEPVQVPMECDPPDGGETPSLRVSVRRDLASSTWPQRFLLMATIGWVAYEWGFGNETVTPWILVRVVSETSGVWSIVAAAAMGFVFTVLQQSISGYTAVYGFALFRCTARAARRSLQTRLDHDPKAWSDVGIGTKALIVFTLGTTAVVLIESTTSGEVGPTRQRGIVLQAALLVGTIVAAIAALGASAVVIGRSVSWLEPPTEWLLRVLGNPLFWIGLLAVVLATNAIRRRSSDSRATTPAP